MVRPKLSGEAKEIPLKLIIFSIRELCCRFFFCKFTRVDNTLVKHLNRPLNVPLALLRECLGQSGKKRAVAIAAIDLKVTCFFKFKKSIKKVTYF